MILTWPLAITIIGVVIPFLAFLYKMIKKDVTLEDVKKYKELNDKNQIVKESAADNKKDIEAVRDRVERMEERFKDLLDKFIDLIKTTK